MIRILRAPAVPDQIEEMQQALSTYIKVAVDIERGILAGGGIMHADCEAALLADGSVQENIWGADWNPATRQVTYEALINIRPGQGNPALEILDPLRRECVALIVATFWSGHEGHHSRDANAICAMISPSGWADWRPTCAE